MEQREFDFQAGLTDQFPEWEDMVHASVYGCGKPFKNVAADLDLSSSNLSRKLNPHDTSVSYGLKDFPKLLRATGDFRPIYWLMEEFLHDQESQDEQALAILKSILPELTRLAKKAEKGKAK